MKAKFMINIETQEKLKHRENQFVDQVTDTIAWYSHHMKRNWYTHRTISVFVMIGSVFTPMLVAGSSLTIFGISDNFIRGAAIISTILLSILEGLRRIFRFEQRWSTCFWARNDLKKLRDQYRVAQIGEEIGSDVWLKNLQRLKDKYYAITEKESRDFLESAMGEAPNGQPVKPDAGSTKTHGNA